MKEDTLTGIQIRMAAPADAPSISAVLRETVAEYRASYTDEAFAAAAPASEQIQSRMNEGPIWVAVRETAIMGFKRSDEGPHDLYGTPLFTMEKKI